MFTIDNKHDWHDAGARRSDNNKGRGAYKISSVVSEHQMSGSVPVSSFSDTSLTQPKPQHKCTPSAPTLNRAHKEKGTVAGHCAAMRCALQLKAPYVTRPRRFWTAGCAYNVSRETKVSAQDAGNGPVQSLSATFLTPATRQGSFGYNVMASTRSIYGR
jgi:deoxyxylulose-5-phosphate synthase